MSSSQSSEKEPCTSSAVQEVEAKGAAKPNASFQTIESMGQRLDLLLSRVITLKNSLKEWNKTFDSNDVEEDGTDDDDWSFDDIKAVDSKEHQLSENDTLVEVQEMTAETEDLDLASN